MTAHDPYEPLIDLNLRRPIWERFFQVAPLVLIGTRDEDGGCNLAPKHMVGPLGWENYFGFICTPSHRTYQNLQREGSFAVSYLRPTQVILASLAAAGRADDGTKPALQALPTFAARQVEGCFVQDAYLLLECELERVVEGFGDSSLIVGHIVAAHAHPDALRSADGDDSALLQRAPLLAYLHPGRFARIDDSLSFPFPVDFER